MEEPTVPRHVLLLPDNSPGWALVRQTLAAMPEPFTVTSATPAHVLAGTAPEPLALALLGAAMPGSIAALQQLGRRTPRPAIGVIVPRLDTAWLDVSGALGAIAYLLWQDIDAGSWPEVLRVMLLGTTVMFSRSIRDVRDEQVQDTARLLARPPSAPLTERELQVARLLIGGLSHQQIADRLGWSQRTVERTVAALRAKHGAPNDICLGARLTGNGCPCPVLVRQAAQS